MARTSPGSKACRRLGRKALGSPKVLRAWLESYRCVAPKKLVARLGTEVPR